MSIKVVSYFGEGRSLGEIVQEEGMLTQHGYITRVSGSLCLVGSGTSESSNWIYDYYLQIGSGQAYQQFSWPTGVNCEVYDRHTLFPNGFVENVASVSGHTWFRGYEPPITFSR